MSHRLRELDVYPRLPVPVRAASGCELVLASGERVLDLYGGHCVNTLPLRFDVDPSQPFSQFQDAAQATLLDALEHQRHTFGTLLKKLRIRRDPARMPLVSALFNLDQALFISLSTVKTHINNLFRKLDAGDREAALRAARELRLLE